MRPVWDAAGQQTADYEARIARMVREGEFELGWIGARAWDRLGITQLPGAAGAVPGHRPRAARPDRHGSVGARMLAGLDGNGLVGLALAPDRLRYPFGVRHALASPAGLRRRARARIPLAHRRRRSCARSGATPVHVSGDDVAGAVARREIDGVEASLGTNSADEGENFLTTNLALFPKVLTLFAGARRVSATRRGSGGGDPQGGSADRGVRRRPPALRARARAPLLRRAVVR